MKLAITRLSVGLLGGMVLLLASACATGTRAGCAAERDFTDEVVLRSANANANMLGMKLLYLDKENYTGLRELITSELDSELLAICTMMKEPSFGSGHSREVSRAVLARIAKYRNQHPQSFSTGDAARDDESAKWAKITVQSCLDESLAASVIGAGAPASPPMTAPATQSSAPAP